MPPGRPSRTRRSRKVATDLDGCRPALKAGLGQAVAHHGELLQGVFEGEDGRLHRGLVTLPFALRQSLVTFWPRSTGGIRTRPLGRKKAARAATLTLSHLGHPGASGDLTIESTIPLGHGYGSSTADVVATIRAVAAAAGMALRRSTVCRLAVAAEKASDAVAYEDQMVLFAQREGRVIEYFAGELPPILIVGFRTGADRPVDTVKLPPARYAPEEIEQFRVLRGLFYHGISHQDPRLIGRVATVSAMISQRYLVKPHLDIAVELAESHGACGIQVAHSGTLIGILQDANGRDAEARADNIAERLRSSGFQDVTVFAIGMDGASAS